MEKIMKYIQVELPYWKKGMKVVCPNCQRYTKGPYICKCGAELKPFVRMKT